MNISPDAEPYEGTEDFFYALTDGGQIDPAHFLTNKADLNRVQRAIEVILDFQASMVESGMISEG